jgi:arylsulfatase A-like enzyme
LKKAFWVLVISVGVGIAVGFWACQRPGLRDGFAVLDASVYMDAAKDVEPVADVIEVAGTAPTRPPNVVVILADDLGYGDVGAYGNALIRTPNLDELANAGARFTNFYASAPICSPSRAGLLTGRYPIRTGITLPFPPADPRLPAAIALRANRWLARAGLMEDGLQHLVNGLPASEMTIAEALKSAGYATGMVGKWHLGDFNVLPRYHPNQHGFDFFAGVPYSNDMFPYSYWKNDEVVHEDMGLRQSGLTDELTAEAIRFIEANRSRPFFLYFAHKNVHTPLFPAPEFAGRSAAGAYGDSVEEFDVSVGEIVGALAARELLDQTLVFVTSDNGPWHLGNPGALRGRKGQTMEGGQRVPAIAHWPGQIPAGSVIAAPAMNIDLFPTLLDLAGVVPPRDRVIDGRSLRGLLSGRETTSPHRALFFFHDNVIDGVRSERWKYYRWVNLYTFPVPLDKVNSLIGRGAHQASHTDPQTGETVQLITHDPLLFDLEADTNESYNVISLHPDQAARLHAAIEAWEREFFDNPRGWK